MSNFVDLISVIGSGVTICQLTVSYFQTKINMLQAEKKNVENFIDSLSKKEVLTAPIDDEVLTAVIKSLENIIAEVDTLSNQTNDQDIKDIGYTLRLTVKTEIRKMYMLDEKIVKDKHKLYRSLQKVRLECSRTLAFLCASFQIEPKDPSFKNFILNYTIQPR